MYEIKVGWWYYINWNGTKEVVRVVGRPTSEMGKDVVVQGKDEMAYRLSKKQFQSMICWVYGPEAPAGAKLEAR